MPGVVIRTQHGPVSYDAGEKIIGGQAVEGRTGGVIGVAAADSATFLGVAINDAVPAASIQTGTVDGVLNAAPLPTRAAIAYNGMEVAVNFSADAAFGERLKVGALGSFVPIEDGDPAVAICTEPGGVVAATKNTGLARIL